jgi:DNA-binding transcriptional LysR family regulator
VRVALDVGTSDNLLPSLVCGDIDLVLGRLPDELDNQAFSVHFFNRGEQMSVIARPGHPLAGKAKITLSDLLDLTWILHPIGSPMRSRVENALRSRKISSKLDIVETASILATTSMVEASDMISVVPYDVALHYANHGMVSILPVKLPISMINLGIVTNKAKPLAPAVLKLIEHIKKYEADNY